MQYVCMENCLKEQKLGLKSDRTSTHTFAGNQLQRKRTGNRQRATVKSNTLVLDNSTV